MSLNGLDEAPVTEAFQAALTEPGGWFLLKYIARDAVDVLSRGSGGVPEVRNAVEKYEEKSPLFGLVQYRRRKVILKFVPDGTSRLLQARLTVQFQSITDKFAPNDAIFSFAIASELTESALSSVCMLHASANSLTSSSSSLRRKRLGEITESAEEGSSASVSERRSDGKPMHLDVDESQRYGRSEPSPLAKITTMDEINPTENTSTTPSKSHDSPRLVIESVETDRIPPVTPGPVDEDKHIIRPDLDRPRQSFAEPRPSYEPRQSSQSTRPSAYDLDTVSLYSGYGGYKKKVKLGPRPSVDRPHTSGSQIRGYHPRPISTLPSGIRPARTQTAPTSTSRPTSRRSEKSQIVSQARFQQDSDEHLENPVPPLNFQLASLYRPNLVESSTPVSPGARSFVSTKSSTITPEKQRLMKALQMRKRQMAEKARQEEQKAQEEEQKKIEEDHKAEEAPLLEEPTEDRPEMQTINEQPNEAQLEAGKDSRLEMTRVVSPISTSEGPSTQGSTFTEEADRSTLDTQDHSFGPDSPKASFTDTPESEGLGGNDPANSLKEDEIASTETVTSPKLDVAHDDHAESLKEPEQDIVLPLSVATDPVNGHPSSNGQKEQAKQAEPPTISVAEAAEQQQISEDTLRSGSVATSTEAGSEAGQGQKKRRVGHDGLKLLVNADQEPSEISDDESFMDDLDNASVHEAQPIQVSRSPISPVFATNLQPLPSIQRPIVARSVSNPVADGYDRRPSASSSTSGIHSRWPPQTEPVPVLTVKKVNVSSGISKRIKALEMFTSRESSISPPSTALSQQSPNTPKFQVSSFRKRASLINKSMPPNMSTTTPPPASLPPPSPTSTPEPSRGSTTTQQNQTPSSPTSPQKKRQSVSVTARIIRESSDMQGYSANNFDSSTGLHLHHSPLIIERENTDASPEPALKPESLKIEPVESPKREKRFSFSSSASLSELISGRPSFSNRQRPTEAALLRAMSETSSTTDAGEEKKESRTSRLRKRMSALTPGSRRNKNGALSPKGREAGARSPPTILETVEQDREPSINERSQEVDIGDVNVQFPDTLLWKRRFMRIDDQGYLILTPPTMEANSRNISKRYHLSEFRKPTLPDLERQELPHSILLDFEDGNTLQCACESRYTQQQVLRMLVDAHSAYHQLYPR